MFILSQWLVNNCVYSLGFCFIIYWKGCGWGILQLFAKYFFIYLNEFQGHKCFDCGSYGILLHMSHMLLVMLLGKDGWLEHACYIIQSVPWYRFWHTFFYALKCLIHSTVCGFRFLGTEWVLQKIWISPFCQIFGFCSPVRFIRQISLPMILALI